KAPLAAVNDALIALIRRIGELHRLGKDPGWPARVDLFLELLGEDVAAYSPAARAAILAAIGDLPEDLAPPRRADGEDTLAELARLALRLGVVSNGTITGADACRELLRAYGLMPYLEFVAFSQELAVAKPDPAIFRESLRAMSSDPADAIFVGDTPETDIVGARDAGLFAVQIGPKEHAVIRPHARVDSLQELIGLV